MSSPCANGWTGGREVLRKALACHLPGGILSSRLLRRLPHVELSIVAQTSPNGKLGPPHPPHTGLLTTCPETNKSLRKEREADLPFRGDSE